MMLNYETFVKIIQIIFIAMYAIIVGFALEEMYKAIANVVLCFFPIMLILIELFRGDDN